MEKDIKNEIQDNKTQKKLKKSTWYTIYIVGISIAIFVIIGAIIFNPFEKEINKEKNRQIAEDYMTKTLESNSKEAEIYRKENEEIIKKYNLDIYGTYSCTYNEMATNADEGTGTTQTITRVMTIKDDSTAEFSDGTKGWWMLKEAEGGIVHMGLVLPEEKTPQIYLVCKNRLIDETMACFIGKVPDSDTFDAEFTAGNLTLKFSKDGKVNGDYTQMVEEDGVEYPHREAYGGQYQRQGDYLDIVLNGSPARYLIFKYDVDNTDADISGFAARYYIKSEA